MEYCNAPVPPAAETVNRPSTIAEQLCGEAVTVAESAVGLTND